MQKNGRVSLGIFGIKHDMTPLELFRKALLGLYRSGKYNIEFKDGDNTNISIANIKFNGKLSNRIFEYRYNGLKKRTPQEHRLWKFINTANFKKYLRLNWINNTHNWRGKRIEFFEQSSFRSKNSFYLIDCVISGLTAKNIGSLGIELDGSQHFSTEGFAYDLDRDMELFETYDIALIRIPNKQFDVMDDEQLTEFLHKKIIEVSKNPNGFRF